VILRLLSARVLHVDIGAESHVVGEIPAFMVWVIVDHDLVAVPKPVIAVGEVKGGNAEIKAAKPETVGTAARDAPHVATAEASVIATVLPGMIEVKAGIVSPGVMPDPLAVVVDVRGFGVVFLITISLGCRSSRRATNWGGPTVRNVSATDRMTSAATMVTVLRKGGERKEQAEDKHS
jgi:hypothetical protein